MGTENQGWQENKFSQEGSNKMFLSSRQDESQADDSP
jgi:hypothetical protein